MTRARLRLFVTLAALAAILIVAFSVSHRAEAQNPPQLFQSPALSKNLIAFSFAGDLWTVARDGGEATRLTTGTGLETHPVFSPDGNWIAFTGEYDGNVDVYVVPATGGEPKRVTHHPNADMPVGWTPDGKQIIFRSGRTSFHRFDKLFTIAPDGVFPAELPLPMGEQASFSPDGQRVAYVPFWNRRLNLNNYISIKRYRGGLASPIWIARLSDSSIEKLPRTDANDHSPMWIGDKIYFLSDRNGGKFTLFSYETGSKRVSELIKNSGFDILSASAGPGAIVYEQFGSLNLFDLSSGQSKKVNVRVSADLSGIRPRYERVAARLTNARISPTGARAVFEARGEIISVPAEKGDARNITNTPGVMERDPAWSPDGKWIAYFSDESGEYALHLREQSGMGDVKKISLGNPPSYFYSPTWSPDSKKIAFIDKRLNLWYVDIDKATPVKVDSTYYENPFITFDPNWSGDSKWLTYTKQLVSHNHAVFVFSVDDGKAAQITDGMSDALYAAFDPNGKYLYFTASTNIGPTHGWLDMSSFQRPVTRSVYITVLQKKDPSPLAPESDDEKVEPEKKDDQPPAGGAAPPAGAQQPPAAAPPAGGQQGAAQGPPGKAPARPRAPEPVKIDFDGIDQRILALPIPNSNYIGLGVGKTGILFIAEGAPVGATGPAAQGFTLQKFDLSRRRVERVTDGLTYFDVSQNGEKLLLRQGQGPAQRWFMASTAQPFRPGEGTLNTANLEVRVEPRVEWAQMYREAWRIQRDFFYDPNHHGADLAALEAKYKPFLAGIGHRADLNYLFNEMLGEMTVQHLYVAGGESARPPAIPGGLLGADYSIENGRYRFKKVYSGQNWNPGLRAPLTQPGVNVVAGEYLLAINGRDLKATDNLFAAFESTANEQVTIKVGHNADASGSRDVIVVPVATETPLRNLDWIEGNRRKVDELSAGKVAYVYLPDTGGGGYANFNRYYFAQVGKDGAILDERFNGGGTAADYMIDYMRRPLYNYWLTREGTPFTTPVSAIFGPKAMIINEFAGSGGDALPWYFRNAKLGPTVGKRTWGGLVGIYNYPPLMDGGSIQSPRVAFYAADSGKWEVENYGTDADIQVELDPAIVRQGRDPQLERAVQHVLDELKKNPPSKTKPEPFPNYHKAPWK